MYTKKIMLLISILVGFLFSLDAFARDQLIFAVDIIRHGDRTPVTDDIPKAPYHWMLGLGELTPEGMQQEFENGVMFRKRYLEQYHLLPANYQSDAMYVRSTDLNRTLMSADSVLLGLYPLGTGPQLSASGNPALPNRYQPIPIHTVPKDLDTVLMFKDDDKQFHALLEKYVFSTKEWQDKTREMQTKFGRWSELTGLEITKLEQIGLLGDNLFIRELHHVPLPEGMSTKEADEIIAAAKWGFAAQYKPYQIGNFTSQKLLTVLLNYFQQAAQQKNLLRYVLFSAHDSTILGVMSALQTPLQTPPHYASDLNFLLFEKDNQQYYLKIIYNGKPVVIPACENKNCSLEQFAKFVDSIKVDS